MASLRVPPRAARYTPGLISPLTILSRPALIAMVVAALGMAAPFWLNAVSNLLMIAAVLLWRVERHEAPGYPPNISAVPCSPDSFRRVRRRRASRSAGAG
jgi:hypothetical protein